MTTTAPTWTAADPDDITQVLALMREFYAEEGLAYIEERALRAVSELVSDPSLGAVFLLQDDSGPQGYLIGSFGYSLEFGGRFVLLDELYLRPGCRGHGERKRALATMEDWAGKQAALTTRLEVNHHNGKALAFYLKSGYVNDNRRILTKWIDHGTPDQP